MDHTFPVTVVDDKGANIAAAVVSLVKKSTVAAQFHPFPGLAATHTDAGGGKYNENATITPTEEDWLLVVSLASKSTVVQPLRLNKGADGEFTASPKPAAVATVTISGALRRVGGTKVKEIGFHVKLFPAAEIVFIAGVDYNRPDVSGGWLFHEYGFNRATILRRKKKIDDGTIVTVFSTAKIWRTKRVWGLKGWVDIEVAKLWRDPADRIPPAAGELYKPIAGLDINVTDFYSYLSEVGDRQPHSVLEIGIFSHSFPGGPILYDTGESAALSGFGAARDPDDFDARPKDFNAHNFAVYPKMKDALAPNCRFTIWGCSATTHFKFASRRSLQAIRAGRPEDEFFIVRNEVEDHGRVVAIEEERTSELRHRFDMDKRFRRITYAAEAARKLGIEVRAGCPGTGSDPSTVDGIEMLSVDLAIYKDVFDYFHAKFAPEFAETNEKWDKGYVDYHALQSRPAVAAPAFATESYFLTINKVPTHFRPGGSATLTFGNNKSVDHPTANVQVVATPLADFVTAGKKGHLYVLKDNDPTKSQAVFVQEDQHVFRVTQNAAHEWKVIGPEI